jgi:hypothetical protein
MGWGKSPSLFLNKINSMAKKQNAVQWLIAQITSSNNSNDLSYPIKIQVSQEVIDEAMRILNHQLMEEWHEGYDEGLEKGLKGNVDEGKVL